MILIKKLDASGSFEAVERITSAEAMGKITALIIEDKPPSHITIVGKLTL
jgi:hypothetical protein